MKLKKNLKLDHQISKLVPAMTFTLPEIVDDVFQAQAWLSFLIVGFSFHGVHIWWWTVVTLYIILDVAPKTPVGVSLTFFGKCLWMTSLIVNMPYKYGPYFADKSLFPPAVLRPLCLSYENILNSLKTNEQHKHIVKINKISIPRCPVSVNIFVDRFVLFSFCSSSAHNWKLVW